MERVTTELLNKAQESRVCKPAAVHHAKATWENSSHATSIFCSVRTCIGRWCSSGMLQALMA